MPIQILSEVVAAQIAAGEVVERPASVVKELIENALDAGATAITVEVDEGGKRLIRVSDNGSGIAAAEADLAFARHSTSKLQTIEDLERIATLGFRGEALASIASVSRTVLVTRHRDETTGITVQVEGGKVHHTRPTGAPAGTVISVENLFFNTPARLKFLKSESTERKHITQLITRYAMAYPLVRFRLLQDGREQFHSTGSGDLADVLIEAFGLETFTDMLEIVSLPPSRPDLPPIDVQGFTSTPAVTRSNRSHIVLFINGRSVVDQSLTYAVVQAYHGLLSDGKYPLAVLLISLPPEEVDVNVHPTKAEVRFRTPDAVFAAVQRAVRQTVADQPPAVPGDAGWGGARTFPRPVVPGEQQLHMELGILDPGRSVTSSPDMAIPAGPHGPARPRTLPIMRVIGQVGALYIVAEGPAGLYLIDQHAAHLRILYELLVRQHAAAEPVDTHEFPASAVDLPPLAARILEDSLELLDSFGCEVELFGSNTFRIRMVPGILADLEAETLLHHLVLHLEMGAEDGIPREETIIQCFCELGAIKAGQMLSYDDMQGLIQQLERCEQPLTTPDGKPTLVHISGEDLARQFGRE